MYVFINYLPNGRPFINRRNIIFIPVGRLVKANIKLNFLMKIK